MCFLCGHKNWVWWWFLADKRESFTFFLFVLFCFFFILSPKSWPSLFLPQLHLVRIPCPVSPSALNLTLWFFFFFFFFWTNREAVLDEMSQCSWGAGHLPAAHSDGTDGSASRMLLGVNCAPRAKLKLTLSAKGSANHRSIGRSEKCTGDDSIAQDGSSV